MQTFGKTLHFMPNQKTNQNKITVRLLLNYLVHALELQKGLIFTFRALIIHPSTSLRRYFEGDHSYLSNPFKYAIVVVATTILIDWLDLVSYLPSHTSGFGYGTEDWLFQVELYFHFAIFPLLLSSRCS